MLTYDDITPKQHKLIDALYGGNVLAIAGKGFGKAMCGQTAAQELIKEGVCERILIVAPLKVCQLTWADEWKKWEHLYAPAMAIGFPDVRKKAIEGPDNIVVINNENVPWLCDNYDLWEWGFDGLLIDEGTKYKSAGATKVRKLRKYLKDFKWRCSLTASPMTETGIDIYAQVLLVDGGKALGRVQDVFRRKYFMTTDFQGYNWTWQPGGEERLAKALQHVIYMADDESYKETLPELQDQIHFVTLPKPAREAYADMSRELVLDFDGEEIEAPTAAVMTQKLQQVAAGAIYDGSKNAIMLHEEKIQALKRIVKGSGSFLIAYWFNFELEALKTAFPGIPVLKDAPNEHMNAWNAGDIKLLAVHPASAGHGLNLQDGGHQMVCLGPIWSLDMWDQLAGRLRRRGQRSPFVKRHTIMAADTVDEIIWDRLQGKEFDEQRIMDHIRNAAHKKARS